LLFAWFAPYGAGFEKPGNLAFAIPDPCHEAMDKTESMSYPWLRCPGGTLHIPQQAFQPRFSHKAADDAQK
jgi:hypothetical protein